MKVHLLVLYSIATISSVKCKAGPHPPSSQRPSPGAEQSVYLSQTHMQFTLDLLGALVMKEGYSPGSDLLQSILFSPISIQSILMMLHLGSGGITEADLAKVLYLTTSPTNPFKNNQNNSMSHEIFGRAVHDLLNDKELKDSLKIANKIYSREDLTISPTYEKLLAEYYQCKVEPINFQNSVGIINDWVYKRTDGLIEELLNGPPSPASTLIALNALYFKGDWEYKFDRRDTQPNSLFQLSNGRRTRVEMMVGKLPIGFGYLPELQTSIIELPYVSKRLGLFVLLHDEPTGLFPLLRSLNASSLTGLIGSMRKTPDEINVRMPKFELRSEPDLTGIFRHNLPIPSLFGREADLSKIFINSKEPVYVNQFLHKAVLKVDEKGSKGAAASASIIQRIGAFDGQYFEADHPFVFLLTDKRSGFILFAGIYAGPDNNPN